MAEGKTVIAVVAKRGYTYRGQPIPKNRLVRLSREQYDKSQRTQPSFFRLAEKGEVDRARDVLDLSSVEAPVAENVRAAEEAAASPPKKK